MSFAAMRPLYTSAFGGAADVGEGEQGIALRRRPYSRGLLHRLSGGAAGEGGRLGLNVGQDSGVDLRASHTFDSIGS